MATPPDGKTVAPERSTALDYGTWPGDEFWDIVYRQDPSSGDPVVAADLPAEAPTGAPGDAGTDKVPAAPDKPAEPVGAAKPDPAAKPAEPVAPAGAATPKPPEPQPVEEPVRKPPPSSQPGPPNITDPPQQETQPGPPNIPDRPVPPPPPPPPVHPPGTPGAIASPGKVVTPLRPVDPKVASVVGQMSDEDLSSIAQDLGSRERTAAEDAAYSAAQAELNRRGDDPTSVASVLLRGMSTGELTMALQAAMGKRKRSGADRAAFERLAAEARRRVVAGKAQDGPGQSPPGQPGQQPQQPQQPQPPQASQFQPGHAPVAPAPGSVPPAIKQVAKQAGVPIKQVAKIAAQQGGPAAAGVSPVRPVLPVQVQAHGRGMPMVPAMPGVPGSPVVPAPLVTKKRIRSKMPAALTYTFVRNGETVIVRAART